VADEFEEACNDLAQGGVKGAQGLGDGGDVGLELGALVGVVDHAQEGAVGVAALGVPGGLVVRIHLALAVAVLDVAVDGLVEGGGGLLDHGAVLPDVSDEAFHLEGDGAGLIVTVGDMGAGRWPASSASSSSCRAPISASMCLRMRAGSWSTLTATSLSREAMPVMERPVAMVSWRRMPRRKSSARRASWVR